MSQRRYLTSFLITLLAFLILGLLLLTFLRAEKILKVPPSQVIKIALISPVKPLKKVTKPQPKLIEKEVVVAPTPIVKKNQKSIIKKPKVLKPKPKPKPKPKKIIKKPKPKKVIKKIVKKSRPKIVPQKRVVPPKKSYYSTPTIVEKAPVTPIVPKVSSNNSRAKKAFLRNVRAKIIANKKYPRLALRRHIEGAVKVRFDITKYGQVTNIRFINGKSIFHKSIRKTLERTFPVNIPNNMKSSLPISDVSVILHFNIR